jgi:thiol-disulfide isomerase/thioredoxin
MEMGAIIAVIVLLVVLILWYFNKKLKQEFKPDTILLFYSPGCVHCKNLKDGQEAVWPKIMQKYKGSIPIFEIDGDNNPKLMQYYKIDGYPTIIKIGNQSHIVYNGDRSFESIDKFISLSKQTTQTQ